MTVGRGRTRACRSAGARSPGPRAPGGEADPRGLGAPDWHAVERLLATLAETRAFFPTATSRSSWISTYEPGRRLRLEADATSKWIQIEHLKACWATFERLRRIRRGDVLEPGRSSAFVMALFARVPGVREERTPEHGLLLPDAKNVPGDR